jgi:hypothetical protein
VPNSPVSRQFVEARLCTKELEAEADRLEVKLARKGQEAALDREAPPRPAPPAETPMSAAELISRAIDNRGCPQGSMSSNSNNRARSRRLGKHAEIDAPGTRVALSGKLLPWCWMVSADMV